MPVSPCFTKGFAAGGNDDSKKTIFQNRLGICGILSGGSWRADGVRSMDWSVDAAKRHGNAEYRFSSAGSDFHVCICISYILDINAVDSCLEKAGRGEPWNRAVSFVGCGLFWAYLPGEFCRSDRDENFGACHGKFRGKSGVRYD